MQNIPGTISEYFTDFKNAASGVLRYALEGTGTVLVTTGTILTKTGSVLKVCAQKVKPARRPRSRPTPIRRTRSVPQPA